MKRRINQVIVINNVLLVLFVISMYILRSNLLSAKGNISRQLFNVTWMIVMMMFVLLVLLAMYGLFLYRSYLKMKRYSYVVYVHIVSYMIQTYVVARLLIIFLTLDSLVQAYHFNAHFLLLIILTGISFCLNSFVYFKAYPVHVKQVQYLRYMIVYSCGIIVAVVIAMIPFQKPTLDLVEHLIIERDQGVGSGYASLQLKVSDTLFDELLLFENDKNMNNQFTIKVVGKNQKQGTLTNGNIQYKISYNPYLDTIFHIKNKNKILTHTIDDLPTFIVDVNEILPMYPKLRTHADMLANKVGSKFGSASFIGSEYTQEKGISQVKFYYLVQKEMETGFQYFLYETWIDGTKSDLDELDFHSEINDNTQETMISYKTTSDAIMQEYTNATKQRRASHIPIE